MKDSLKAGLDFNTIKLVAKERTAANYKEIVDVSCYYATSLVPTVDGGGLPLINVLCSVCASPPRH